MNRQEKLDIVVKTINCIFDNWQADGSFGRLVELIRERLDLAGVAGSWEAIQCAGGLSLNNALPGGEAQADFLEESAEHVQLRFDQYILTQGLNISSEQYKSIADFVGWFVKQDQEDLVAPRGSDGKSFAQRREDKQNE